MGTTPTFICLDDKHVLWQYINCDVSDAGIHGCHDRRRCQNSARNAIVRYGINRERIRGEIMANIKKKIKQKWAHVPKTKRFNGKVYRRDIMPCDSKTEAERAAKSFRSVGQLARVVKVENYWWVYRRIPEHLRTKMR